ncbi:MAG: undecaprenyl-diphosphate phosphatase [Alphaproteobacteria bacterium]|nr:undecaprenyl-diphosphate phosphatase [Alphaproteobacteria bacterium]
MFLIALLLGIIEGMTEFIPVSSTGHLILFGDILGFEGPPGKVFEIVIQLGAICAVCWLYRQKIFQTAAGVFKGKKTDMRFSLGIAAAFLPAMVLGALLHQTIKTVLFTPHNVSIALIVGGIAILLVERFKPRAKHHAMDKFSLPLCFKIGLCQCLALIPGTSRSGATIMGAMLLGVDRKAATEFSFFLAIPTLLAAVLFDIYKNWSTITLDGAQLIVVGFLAAFISAMLVVKAVIAYVARHGFTPFALYRITLGVLMLYLLG